MRRWKQAGRSRMRVAGILIAVLVGVAALAIGLTVQDRTLAQEVGLEGAMALSADGSDVSCSSGSCNVPPGGEFTLSVLTAGIPDGGYIGIQTQVFYQGVRYMPTEAGEGEVYSGAGEDVWPDNYFETGTAWVFYSPIGGYQNGPYQVTLEVKGQVVATATFVIEPGGL